MTLVELLVGSLGYQVWEKTRFPHRASASLRHQHLVCDLEIIQLSLERESGCCTRGRLY